MKTGETLYKYQGFGVIAEYICTAVIKRNQLTTYEMECQTCSHGFKCLILVEKVRGKDTYEFLTMVNDEDGEYRCWHTSYDRHQEYYPTPQRAKIAVYEDAVSKKKRDIKRNEDKHELLLSELADIEAHLVNVTETEVNND